MSRLAVRGVGTFEIDLDRARELAAVRASDLIDQGARGGVYKIIADASGVSRGTAVGFFSGRARAMGITCFAKLVRRGLRTEVREIAELMP